MARIYAVKAARVGQRNCGRCAQPINIGDPYRWSKPRAGRWTSGFKMVRCMQASCNFRPSEMTTSRMGEIYAAQEGFSDTAARGFENFEDLKQAMTDTAEAIREVAEGYSEGARNIEDGFGHATMQSEEMEEKGSELETWVDDLEGFDPDGESEYDELASLEADHETDRKFVCPVCSHTVSPKQFSDDCPAEDCGASSPQEAMTELLTGAASEAEELVGACPV